MKGLKGFFWLLFKFFGAYTLLVYALTYWVPTPHWTAGFLMMSLPLTFLVNIIFVFIFLLADTKKSLAPIFLLVLGSVFLPRTFQFGNNGKGKASAEKNQKSFSIMNYNVYGFWVTQGHVRSDDEKTQRMKEWILRQHADILCMPEFNNEKQFPVYRTIKYFRESGYPYYNVLEKNSNENSTFKSLAIFSRFPIIKHREEAFEQQNGLMYADVVIRKDTVRIIGVHLYSMSLQLKKLISQKEFDGVKRETRSTLSSIKRGFSARVKEVSILEKWIRESPHPVIVCGDFNETPYSYFYGRTRAQLKNAFEEKGEGFGFTYNRIPWFIRIDNQFYSDKTLNLLEFETIKGVKYSDHNPSIGKYSIR